MKGDYIYCLNPSCHMLSKDIVDNPDSRNDTVKRECPYCHGTNTINANKEIFYWEQKRIRMTKDCLATINCKTIEDYAIYLVIHGIIDTYTIQQRQGRSRQNYLYNTTNYTNKILAQAKLQGVQLIKYKTPSKALNRRIPDLSNSRGTKKPVKPNLENVDEEVLGYRTKFDITPKDKKDQTICNGEN